MSLKHEISTLVKACCTGIWVASPEPAEVERELTALANDPSEGWSSLYSWDIYKGSTRLAHREGTTVNATAAPKAAVQMLADLGKSTNGEGCHVLVLHNLHKFVHMPDVLQGLANELQAAKQTRTVAVVVTPHISVPVELKTYFTVLNHELPTRPEIEQIVRELFPDETKDRQIPTQLVDAASGLTRFEAENAFSISLVREGRLNPKPVFEYKSQALAKDGTLTVYKGSDRFADLGGLDSIKQFCLRALQSREDRKSVAKGVIALGVPGAGKSAFAKALGNETGRPTVCLDISNMLSKFVGESEGRLRQALNTLEAVSPCVCFVDEIEKGLSGVGSGLDSGVLDRIFGMLLTWRQDTKADVFLIATSNNVSKMPAPLLRAGRTNAIFFFDLPSREEKDLIWQMYLKHYGVHGDIPDDTEWTGAEIKNCCELAELLDISLPAAATMVVPISLTSSNQIDELRQWAEGRVLSASTPGIYHRGKIGVKEKPQKRRNLKSGNENLN